MDEKKAKKAGAKGKQQVEEDVQVPSGSGEIVFGAGNTDMVNFGGDDDEFVEKEREPNIIRK